MSRVPVFRFQVFIGGFGFRAQASRPRKRACGLIIGSCLQAREFQVNVLIALTSRRWVLPASSRPRTPCGERPGLSSSPQLTCMVGIVAEAVCSEPEEALRTRAAAAWQPSRHTRVWHTHPLATTTSEDLYLCTMNEDNPLPSPALVFLLLVLLHVLSLVRSFRFFF